MPPDAAKSQYGCTHSGAASSQYGSCTLQPIGTPTGELPYTGGQADMVFPMGVLFISLGTVIAIVLRWRVAS